MKKLLALALVATIAVSGTTIKSHAYTPFYRPVKINIPKITSVTLPDAVAKAAREAGAEAARKLVEDMKKGDQ